MDCELSNMLLLPCLVFNVKVNQHVLQHLSLDLFMNSALLKQISLTYGKVKKPTLFETSKCYFRPKTFQDNIVVRKHLILTRKTIDI